MNAHKINMYAGAIIGSLLFFLLLGFFSDLIFVGRGHTEHEPLAFAVEIEAEAEGGHEEAATDWAALIAAADPAAGEKLFKKCSACHKLEDGANGVGPTLWGVVDREIASVSGYTYSDALSGMAGDWTFDNLQAFLESPKGMVADTKMSFKGLSKPEDRANLIVYLNEADGSPVELAPPTSGEAPASGTEGTATTGAAAETATAALTTEAASEPAAATGGGEFAALLASADPAAGEKLFKKCSACHKVEEGKNGVGPSLWGVVGSDIASVAGYAYSDALSGMDGDWTFDNLQRFLESPKGMVAGTKMTFKGLPNAADRVNLIVYLNEADGSPIELTAAPGAGTEVAAAIEAATETVVEKVVEPATEAVTETVTEAVEAATESATETVAAVTEAVKEAAPAGGGSFGDLLADARIDVQAGEKVFRKCRACHKLEEGQNGVGPSLWSIVGRDVASVEGYDYSDAMMAKEGNWTGAGLFAYLENPRAVVPGTKMAFPGLKDVEDRINVIVFLNEVDGSPAPLD